MYRCRIIWFSVSSAIPQQWALIKPRDSWRGNELAYMKGMRQLSSANHRSGAIADVLGEGVV